MQKPFIIREFIRENGDNPFRKWLDSLDMAVKARMQARVARIETGNLGDHKSVGDGVFEMRVDTGPGYRIYFAKDGLVIVLLLCGGDKKTQTKDIKKAKEFLEEYLEDANATKK